MSQDKREPKLFQSALSGALTAAGGPIGKQIVTWVMNSAKQYWGFTQMGVLQNGWFYTGLFFKIDDLGVPPF